MLIVFVIVLMWCIEYYLKINKKIRGYKKIKRKTVCWEEFMIIRKSGGIIL